MLQVSYSLNASWENLADITELQVTRLEQKDP